MEQRLAVILESTVEADCPQVEIDELRENTEEISTALRANGFSTRILPFTLDLASMRRELLALQPKVVFNLVDSIEGKGDLVQMAPLLLEHMGIPFTGTGSMAMTVSCHKLVAKQIMRGENIPTADWLTEDQIASCERLAQPHILKSVTEHASFGMFADSIVADAAVLRARLHEKQEKYWGEWFAEAFIDGREFNLSVLATETGPRVLPFAEIVFTEEFPANAPRIVDYAAKWHEESGECKGTVRRFDFDTADSALLTQLENIALACWCRFGLTGYARVDFRIDAQGNPYVLEVNANPFLTANEGFGAAAARADINFNQVINGLVNDGLRRAGKSPLPASAAA